VFILKAEFIMPNSSRRANRCLAASMLLLFLLAAFARESQAQEQSQYDRGTPPQHAAGISSLGSYDSADIGTVNLSNGALNIKLPLGSVGGRGFGVPLSLNYSSKVWSVSRGEDMFSGGDTQNGAPANQLRMAPVVYASYANDDISTDFYTRVAPGWTIGAQPSLKAINRQIGSNSNLYGLTTLTLVLPDKGEVQFRDDLTNGAPSRDPSGSGTYHDGYRGSHWHASDGSGTIYISDSDNGPVSGFVAGVVITSEGTRYRFVDINAPSQTYPYNGFNLGRCTSITDRNGNTMQISYPSGGEIDYTDQLGRVTRVQQNVADPENPGVTLALLVTIPGYQGQSRYYKIKLGTMHDYYRSDTHPQLPVITGDQDLDTGSNFYAYPGPHTSLYPNSWGKYMQRIDDQDVVTEMVLPDHRSIHFAYNEHGEVAEVQTPTGGKMQYDYDVAGALPSGNTLSWEKSTGSPIFSAVQDIDRALVARRVYTNGTVPDSAWSYGYGWQSVNGTNYHCTTVKANAGSIAGALLVDQRHLFLAGGRYLFQAGRSDGTGYTVWSTGLEWRTETYDATGTLIAASEQDWSQRVPVNWSPTTYAQEQPENDNRVNEERKILETGQTARVHTLYDDYNNPTDVSEYDFDNTLKRHTVTSYLTTNPINGVNYTGSTDTSVHLLRLPKEATVYDGSGNSAARSVTEYDNYAADSNHAALQDYGANVTGHDATYDANKQVRGLVTAVGQWLDTTNTLLYSYPRYDILGNVVSAKDARGFVSTISYADDYGDGSNPGINGSAPAGVPTYALPTLITSAAPTPGAAPHTARSQYDYYSGLLTGFRDRNNVVTQSIYNDSFDRPTLIKTALGVAGVEAHTQMYYAPATVFGVTLANDDVLTAKDQTTLDDASLRGWTHTDGFGRVRETWTRDPQGDVKVETEYDELGRQKRASNPYRPSQNESAIYTTTSYDMLGRAKNVTTADNAVVTTNYNGTQVTVTDQAGKSRQSVTDALGRLMSVTEDAGDASHLNYQTNYQYDTLGNLRSVAQGQQTRSFVYDSLKRLKTATNPESGAISYDYDNNGNLLTKTDARGITATYLYDALNRATSRSYSDSTPAVTYTYDTLTNGKGRLTSVSSSVSATSYAGYDALGRVVGSTQTTSGAPSAFAMSYAYDLAGHETSETYPSGRVITNSYDSAGREQSVAGQMSGASKTYASQFSYAAHGAIKAMQLGNNLWEHSSFNNRLQPEQIGLGTLSTNASVLQLDYTYHAPNAADNNGNVQSQTITAAGMAATQNYTYDALNRLKVAQENNGASWKQTFIYDRYGNRNFDTANTTQNVLGANPVISAANNRIVPQTNEYYRYDSAGNLDRDVANTAFTYDAENKQSVYAGGAANGGANYYYDGDGKRVKKVTVSETTVFVYDVGGQLVAEYNNQQQQSGSGTSYLTTDNLGTPRVITDGSGAVKARHDYLPFGEELYAGVGGRTAGQGYVGDSNRFRFAKLERDDETGLDYAKARYYANVQGRFTSPDPLMASAKPSMPQTWNRYTYCNNNPVVLIDPTGLDWYFKGKDGDPTHHLGESPTYFKDKPEDGYTKTTSYTYYGGEQTGYVSLNPFSNNYTSGLADNNAAQRVLANNIGNSPLYALEKGIAGMVGSLSAGLVESGLNSLVNLFRSGASQGAAEGVESTVSVFHGSINDASNIRANGLDPSRGTAFVSRDIDAARNAIGPFRYEVSQGMAADPGIIESRIPMSSFERHFAPFERNYSGFSGGRINSTEIPLRTPDQMLLFNRHIVGQP